MKAVFKVRIKGEHIEKVAYLDNMLRKEELTPCCERMKDAILDENIFFDGEEDNGKVCCNFHDAWSDGDIWSIDFCPFCGEAIVLEEGERIKMVNHPKRVPGYMVDNWVEEK